jgi:glutamate-1-semialdehyde 2,1-aminomutase
MSFVSTQPLEAARHGDEAASLIAALAAAKRRYASRCHASHAQWLAASQAMPGGNTRTILYFDPFPICMMRAEGCRLYDADGHCYVDLLGEYTAGIYGHSSPVIQDAIIAALKNGLSLSAHNGAEARLANLLRERYPSIERVRFTNSGTEANLMAIATAMAFTGRRRILVFEGAYHGGLLKFGGDTPSPINVPHEFVVAPYNDIAAALKAIRDNASDLACIVVEPMLGSAGCIPGDPLFLKTLAAQARATRSILIFDEVQTARLSTGGRQATLGIRPDLTTLGKYHGGGLSFGAFGGREDVMSLYDPGRPGHLSHAGTFNNNVLSMTAGYEGLSKLLTAEALDSLNARGDALRRNLNQMFAEFDTRITATGLGSLMNFHAAGDAAFGAAAIALLFFELLERGYYFAPRGFIALSLPIEDAMLDGFLEAMRDVLRTHAALL